MAPVTDEIFGCQIFVTNLTLGGLNGYVSGTFISREKRPPSYGVSGGPAISPLRSVHVSFINSIFIAHCEICEHNFNFNHRLPYNIIFKNRLKAN